MLEKITVVFQAENITMNIINNLEELNGFLTASKQDV